MNQITQKQRTFEIKYCPFSEVSDAGMITPMVARLVRDPFDREGWLFELKWDGFRAIAETDGTGKVSSTHASKTSSTNGFPPSLMLSRS